MSWLLQNTNVLHNNNVPPPPLSQVLLMSPVVWNIPLGRLGQLSWQGP